MDQTAQTAPKKAAPKKITVDGNEAVASVAHRMNEVIAIYPITPSSPMGELSDARSADGQKNIWGDVPQVIEMQSEAGAAGTVHGALQSGAVTTTFTSSQGLLLMIPNLYKIAGELLPFCMHVAARTVATHALSIFGDHSDVMACRQTGLAMLSSATVQEAHDFACIAQAATFKTRVPFMHFMDGFRTSHEVSKIDYLEDCVLKAMMDEEALHKHRDHGMSPDHPVVRGTSQNPDTFFQMQEARNLYHDAVPDAVQDRFDDFAKLTGRQYQLFEYHGAPDAERLVVIMGSSGETVREVVDVLNTDAQKLGVLQVRLFRPFSWEKFVDAIPQSVKSIAVLDRTKENGALGEPLYMDVVGALNRAGRSIKVIGGRYGLSSKEFTASMASAVYDELAKDAPKPTFTIGIIDDVSQLSLDWDECGNCYEPGTMHRAMFFGLGSDGTVGANKNAIKIIADNTDNYVQGYFVYDSKKAGAVTVSHLRFAAEPIRSSYLIHEAEFLACHQFHFLDSLDVLSHATPGGTFLLNAPYGKDYVWDKLPRSVQQQIVDKHLKFYVIDARKIAQDAGMGKRINTVMMVCFFQLSDFLDHDVSMGYIKAAIEKTYGGKGEDVVKQNFAVVDSTLAQLEQVEVPKTVTSEFDIPPVVSPDAPDFVQGVTATMLAGKGDLLPVSAFPIDGTWPTNTAKWEKRNLASEIPTWIEELCIQCNKCALVCPHAAIRVKAFGEDALASAPPTFKSMDYKGKEFGAGAKYSVQVAPEDCTGCKLCVMVCPGKDKKDPDRLSLVMASQAPLRALERKNFAFFDAITEADRTALRPNVKMSQLAEPLFEFSGACSGCGETPYIKLMSQLYGDRAVIANATGCSSIYGGNLPTTPYSCNADGRGPAWANSLFEDNAEFGLGLRLGLDKHHAIAKDLLAGMRSEFANNDLVDAVLAADQSTEAGINEQRDRVETLRARLADMDGEGARKLANILDHLVKKSLWIIGGDGWAYDIGYGGLDHVIASGANVNILVLDTEVYSNTGGQQSKATPLGATAKFASAGKALPKKDLGLMAISYGHVYVASVALGAKDAQTVKAFQEAEQFDGPSLIIANSPCGEHGYDLAYSLEHQTLAVETGYWPLYRFDPRLIDQGKAALQLDSKAATRPISDLLDKENRFRQVARKDPERAAKLVAQLESELSHRRKVFEALASVRLEEPEGEDASAAE
ncbi:pyruvate:ferredoxin (flavodoxin) oxidoreductase [Magnetovibrio sp. PR-2]|uniref:pyruvate:ferredoxin (flavodoxin) oxidoreductase n=1 Tax=Magnetovibrio sp. PR-2 TaxID=3120356 RepID=UPI002FCE4788